MDLELNAILDRHGLADFDPQTLGRLPADQLSTLQTELLALADSRTANAADNPQALAAVVDVASTVLEVIEAHPEIVTAAATRLTERAKLGRVAARRPTSVAPRAAARSNIVTAGGQRIGFDELGEHVAAAMRDGSRLTSGLLRVATIEAATQMNRLGNDAFANSSIIASAIDRQRDTLTASGGLCGPTQAIYDVPVIPSDARPVRDALVRFVADRGGVRFFPPPTLADVAGGTMVWTEAVDQNPGEMVKPVVTMTCGEEVEEFVSAITAALQFGNFRQRFFGESVQQWLAALFAAQARLAEQTLLTKLIGGSTAANTGTVLGTARDVLAVLDRAGAAYRSRQRLNASARLVVILPAWVRDQMRADLTRQAPGDSTLSVTDAQIGALFDARHYSVAWSIDWGTWGAQPDGAALNGWPSTLPALVFAPGTWLFLDGGVLDFGIIRDSTLSGTNDTQMFSETFEQAAMVGTESLALTLDVCPDGSSSAAIDISPCTTGS